LPPPEIRRRSEDNFGDHDNGNNSRPPGKPPVDKRTGGNGDGDNWNNRPQGRRGPRERLSQARVGLFFALGGDLMFFIALISVFFVNKVSGHFDAYNRYINDWLPTVIPSILWLNTGVLILSSATAEAARQSMFRESDAMDEWLGLSHPVSKRATIWLSATLLLGATFLAGQWTAWHQLAAQHVFMHSNPSSHYFYLITATHAAHLLLGIVALLCSLTLLRRSRSLEQKQVWVDSTVWYWHVMGALWIFLFVLLEFCQ
jgi:cytochrome c oxidase subunit 3